eukprot:351673-Chlamydomonas_euryale.AAC.1
MRLSAAAQTPRSARAAGFRVPGVVRRAGAARRGDAPWRMGSCVCMLSRSCGGGGNSVSAAARCGSSSGAGASCFAHGHQSAAGAPHAAAAACRARCMAAPRSRRAVGMGSYARRGQVRHAGVSTDPPSLACEEMKGAFMHVSLNAHELAF